MQIESLSRIQETINAYLARIDKWFDRTKWNESKQFKLAGSVIRKNKRGTKAGVQMFRNANSAIRHDRIS